MEKGDLFFHAAPIFAVPDVRAAAEFYRDNLGFTIEFLWEDPPSYGVLRRGEGVSIHLVSQPSPRPSFLYVFVHDVDLIYAEWAAKEVEIIHPIGDRDYGMRDFDVQDPWGNRLTIGQGSEDEEG